MHHLNTIKIAMLLTRASEYALLSLILLSQSTTPLHAEQLADKLDISKSFLAKILQNLVRARIIRSFRGAKGGYALVMPVSEITMKHILLAAESKQPAVFDCANSESNCPSNKSSTCAVWPFINTLQTHIDGFLEGLTLQDLLQK